MENVEVKHRHVFTVFTATYNRAHTLYRVYESLKVQTFRDFEWIIGDDGSADGTETLVKQWQGEADFRIRYFWQENAGKNFIFNRGVREAKGEYFAELDSDDALKPEALERALHHWKQIPAEEIKKYFVLLFSCEDDKGKIVGPFFNHSPCDYDFRKFNYSRKYRSEKWRCFKTDVLRQYPFREDARNCHIFESTLYCEIAKKYKARFVNEIARIYYLDGPSLTRQPKHPMQNLEGLRLSILYTLNNDLDFFFQRPLHFLRKALNFTRFSLHFNILFNKQYISLTKLSARSLWYITLPLAVFVFCVDILRDRTPEAAERSKQSGRMLSSI
ncbi:MAG: glycosyltransferase family 2 protein [Geobacter sp.]|nr:glycosyltransferase family 2 protein [Geobacter sp.]